MRVAASLACGVCVVALGDATKAGLMAQSPGVSDERGSRGGIVAVQAQQLNVLRPTSAGRAREADRAPWDSGVAGKVLTRGGATGSRGTLAGPPAAAVLGEAFALTVVEASVLLGILDVSSSALRQSGLSDDVQSFITLVTWAALIAFSGFLSTPAGLVLDRMQLFKVDAPLNADWYGTLRKPLWNPPYWVFPLMWFPLKILQVFACYEMWTVSERKNVLALPVVGYAVHKALGDVWNKVFFVRRRLGLGSLIISMYWLSLAGAIALFWEVSPKAGALFAPTLAWVTVAASLQLRTWRLNA